MNLLEYAIPYRAAYADIYYLLPVMLGIPIVLRHRSVWLGVLLLVALASQQNLLGLVHGWYAIPVRVAGLTLFSLGVLWHWRQSIISAPSRLTLPRGPAHQAFRHSHPPDFHCGVASAQTHRLKPRGSRMSCRSPHPDPRRAPKSNCHGCRRRP